MSETVVHNRNSFDIPKIEANRRHLINNDETYDSKKKASTPQKYKVIPISLDKTEVSLI